MDFDSPDVEKDFPGLHQKQETGIGRKKDESDSDGDHDKISKKELLIGRRKDKKDKKDRGYAALDSSEEEIETKSPSKSFIKTKAFKFPSKSKEKREKSRDKEKDVKEKDKDTLDKKKDKDKKEKDKKEKVKDKDKDKKEKKIKQASVNEEILELGDVQPIFGVSLGLSVERSRCHDSVNLPLVIRDSIDYLQEHGLSNENIYKTECVKARLQQLKKLYNNRESTGIDDFDVPTACGLLKLFLKELPEPILTTDLTTRFEESAALPDIEQQEQELINLIDQLPSCNKTLLAWLILHFDHVTQNEKTNKLNAQNLVMLLSPQLQLSHRLFLALLCHCSNLFADTILVKYIPPMTSTSPFILETPEEIIKELKKQESLLTQIHSEMNAGFVTKKREEQLWEVQRIITQLKRKLRSFEKKQDSTQKSIDDTVDGEISIDLTIQKTKSSCSDDESSLKTTTIFSAESTTNTDAKNTPTGGKEIDESIENLDKIIVTESGLLMLPEGHPDYMMLLRLQLENQELASWKLNLQKKINDERTELVRLKHLLNTEITKEPIIDYNNSINNTDENDTDYERVIGHYIKENALLEQKRNMLACEIFEENNELIQLQVELNLKQFHG